MAVEQPGYSIGWLKAAVDLSAAQYHLVKVTDEETFNKTSVEGEVVLGVLQDKPKDGSPGNIMNIGITKVVAGVGGLAGKDQYMTAADGTAIKAVAGKVVAGVVVLGAAEGKLASVTIGLPCGATAD